MNMYGIRLLIGMMFLFLLEGCKKEEITWSVTTGETRLTLHYDWVGTPEESQVPKGTSLLLYPSNGMGTEIIETGLDGYTKAKEPDTYGVVVYNRNFSNMEVTGLESLDSVTFHSAYAKDGFLLEPSWLLAAVNPSVMVKKEEEARIDMKMRAYVHRIYLIDAGLSSSDILTCEGTISGLRTGVRLKDTKWENGDGKMRVHFERTDAGWIASFLSFGIDPESECLLSRTITYKNGHVENITQDLGREIVELAPEGTGESQYIRLDNSDITSLFQIRANDVAISGNTLLLASDDGIYVSESISSAWTTPVRIEGTESLGTPFQSITLCEGHGLATDRKGNCLYLSKEMRQWKAKHIPLPVSSGKVKEVAGFGKAVAISKEYAAISAPGSLLWENYGDGAYNQFKDAGVVYIYRTDSLAVGNFSPYRILSPSPLMAMTGYGNELSMGREDYLAIGVREGIQSYSADIVDLSSFKRVPFDTETNPLGFEQVITDGKTFVIGNLSKTVVYKIKGTTLLEAPADFPVLEDVRSWSISGDRMIGAGTVYRETSEGWQRERLLVDSLSLPGGIPLGWGRCCALDRDRVVIASDEMVYVIGL